MKFDTTEWKTFLLNKLYKIKMGNGFDKDKMTMDNPEVNFVSRVSYNNGVDIKIDRVIGTEPFPAGLVTVALGGSYLGSCFIQEEPFYTAQNVAVMEPVTKEITHNINLFITVLVRFECRTKYYAFGRELNIHINRDFSIDLPIKKNMDGTPVVDNTFEYSDDGYVPDWQFIEEYMKSLRSKPLTTKNRVGNTPELDVSGWKEFVLGNLFEIKKGKRLTAEDQEEGNNNYIGAIDSNNGIANHIGQAPIHSGNTITLSYDGSIGEAFYQKDPYWATDAVNALYSKYEGFNKYIGLFILPLLRQEKYRFSYGRKWTIDKMKSTIIRLPIQRNYDGTPIIDANTVYSDEGYIPDWQYMEDYIKSLPYGDRL